MKKVVQILYSGLGGTGSVFFSMIDSNAGKKYEHHAIFYGIEPLCNEYEEKCKQMDVSFYYFLKKRGLDLSTQNKIRKLINQIKPDAIINHSAQTIFACYAHRFQNASCKFITVEHQANHLKTDRMWTLSKLSLKFSDQVVYLTNNYRIEVEEKLKKALDNSIHTIIPNGISLKNFKPQKRNENKNEISLGMISRLTPNKDHPTLLRAIKLLKGKPYFDRLKLHIAGSGITQKPLESTAEELEIDKQVVFTGFLNEEQIVSFLQNLDIYIHATYGETMSTAIMQAQATGLPIIASNVKGVNNVINHLQNGLLVELENAEVLAEKIDLLVNDKPMRQKFSEASLKFAKENLSSEIMAEKYFKLIESQ